MRGKSATILLPDVDVSDDLLERLLFEGCTMHAGQACILNSRLLLPEAIHDEVVDRLAALSRGVVIGDPVDPAVTMGPLISREHLDRVEDSSNAPKPTARPSWPGSPPEGSEQRFLFRANDTHRRIRRFVHRAGGGVRSRADRVAVSRRRRRGDHRQQFVLRARRGGVGKRHRPCGGHRPPDQDRTGFGQRHDPGDAPFGGFKQSGIGREGGVMGLRAYMEPKAIGIPA